MKYISNLQDAKNKIISMYPEFKNSDFKSDDTGWANYVVKVDDKYIFRFSRNEESYKIISIEEKLLNKLKKYLPNNIQIPDYKYKDLSDSPFVGYEMIKGRFINKTIYDNFSLDEKNKFLNNMKTFLDNLHSLSYEDIAIPFLNVKKYYEDLYKEIKDKCYNLFDSNLKEKTDNLFNEFLNSQINYKESVVHGDLTTDHILVTDDGIGIIDFGDVRIFDSIFDFAWVSELDNTLVEELLEKEDVERFKFYINIIPYHRVLYGVNINYTNEINAGIKELRKIYRI